MTGTPPKDYRREINAVYPEPLSRLNRVADQNSYKRAVKKKIHRSARFRTTPVTFDEIKATEENPWRLKEVDEETMEEVEEEASCAAVSKSEHDLKIQFQRFMEKMDRRKPCMPKPLTPEAADPQVRRGSHGEDDFPTNYTRRARPSI